MAHVKVITGEIQGEVFKSEKEARSFLSFKYGKGKYSINEKDEISVIKEGKRIFVGWIYYGK